MQYQMKNINSKSFKQYQQNPSNSSNKRSISPFVGSSNQNYQALLQSNSNSNQKSGKKKIINNSPYQRAMKQFQSYGKAQRKKISNYIDSQSKQQHNKFRIVTEPVDDRIMHLAQSNLFNSSLANKNGGNTNAYVNKKMETQTGQVSSSGQIRLNLRQNSNNGAGSSTNVQPKSRERVYTNGNMIRNFEQQQSPSKSGQRHKNYSYDRNSKQRRQKQAHATNSSKCKNCSRFAEQLQYLNIQIKKILKTKQLWKSGEITYEETQQFYNTHGASRGSKVYGEIKKNDHNTVGKGIQKQKQTPMSIQSPYSHNSLQNLHKSNLFQGYSIQNSFKFADIIINQIKSSISSLICEIQSLTSIDYPKMLQMQIFKYEPSYSQFIDVHQTQLKQLFGQLRMNIQGKISEYDTYDTQSENHYVKKVMVNMKTRLGSCLRENLQLRICKAIYEKSQEISEQSEQYLRKVIQQVIENYVQKPKYKQKQKQKQRQRQKQKIKSAKLVK